jgi:hypothetical protein
MTDRIVRSLWWILVIGFTAVCAIGSIYCGYFGLGEMLAGRWHAGTTSMVIGITLTLAVALACRHRSDLLYG